jgi:HSP20 family protein
MAEVRITKEPKAQGVERFPWFGLETPWFRHGLLGVDPFALMKTLTQEMDRVFLYDATLAPPREWRPTIEVKQKKGKLLMTAELPGVNKEDVKVHVTDNALVVEGERKYDNTEKGEEYFHTERSYGRFYRAIPLPDAADAGKATAQFNNGVLKVVIPTPEILPATREIPVTEGIQGKAETAH